MLLTATRDQIFGSRTHRARRTDVAYLICGHSIGSGTLHSSLRQSGCSSSSQVCRAAGSLDTRHSLEPAARDLLTAAPERIGLTARGYHRVLRVSRTNADLDDEPVIAVTHVAEVLRYRPANCESRVAGTRTRAWNSASARHGNLVRWGGRAARWRERHDRSGVPPVELAFGSRRVYSELPR